jgi:hypothetical protein
MSLVLLIISALLGGLFYLQWHEDVAARYRQPVSAEEPVSEGTAVQSIPSFVPVPITSLREITDRPLFTEGRTPPEQATDAGQNIVAVEPLRLKLEGVAITPDSKVAIITDMQTSELLRLSQGMSHGNWKVTGISEQSVTIQQGPRETTLTLEIDVAPGASGTGPRVPFKIPLPRPPASR